MFSKNKEKEDIDLSDVYIDLNDVTLLSNNQDNHSHSGRLNSNPSVHKVDIKNIDNAMESDQKRVVINENVPKKNVKKLLQSVKSQVMEYLDRDCNIETKLATRSNILWVVNHDQKEILLKGVSLGSLCLTSINEKHIKHLVSPSGYGIRIERH